MANASYKGFRGVKTRAGTAITYKRRQAVNSNTTAMFTGDAVLQLTTGLWYLATTTTAVFGSVMKGASYVNSASERTSQPYLPVTTTGSATLEADSASYIFVVEDVNQAIFEGQMTGSTVTMSAGATSNILKNFAIVLGAGTTANGMSGHEIDGVATGGTASTTATLPVRIHDMVYRADNDFTLANAKVEFVINAGTESALAGQATAT